MIIAFPLYEIAQTLENMGKQGFDAYPMWGHPSSFVANSSPPSDLGETMDVSLLLSEVA